MAAGVAIICNTTEHVQSVVCDNDLGIAVDFSDHQRLARAIDELSNAKDRIVAMSRRAHRLFETSFNWEQASAPMYRQLATLMEARSARKYHELDFSWIEQGRQMRELCEQLEGGRAIFTDPTLGLMQLVARRLIGLPFLRSAARGFFASLPDRAGRRIKMRIVALTRL